MDILPVLINLALPGSLQILQIKKGTQITLIKAEKLKIKKNKIFAPNILFDYPQKSAKSVLSVF